MFDDDEWLENKILVLAYLFDKYLNAQLPNNAVADYSNYKYYERVRNRLKEEGKIEVKVSGRGAELLGLTKEGRRYVEKLLFNGLEKPNGSQFSSKWLTRCREALTLDWQNTMSDQGGLQTLVIEDNRQTQRYAGILV
jgi:hypothetical protein